MNKKLLSVSLLLFGLQTQAQVGIGTLTDTGKQTVIGSRSTTVDGVLVLESANKALVLPKVANPHLTVKSPYPGMMCYDTAAKALAVYDGANWSYWK